MIKRKKFTFVITLLFCSFMLTSQVRYGIRGSLQFTNIRNIHEESQTRTFAPALGLFAQIPLNDRNYSWFFKPEIMYSEQGEYNAKAYGIKYYQTYINIPLMFKLYFQDFIFPPCCRGRETHEFFVEAGPQVGFLVKQKNKQKDDMRYGGASLWDLSLGLGGGISFDRKHEIGVRYNYGVIDIYKDYKGYSDDGWPKIHNTSNLSVSYFYFF